VFVYRGLAEKKKDKTNDIVIITSTVFVVDYLKPNGCPLTG